MRQPDGAATDPLIGSEIGNYVLRERIGEGGMGAVYLAIHPSIGSRVAIKVLSGDCSREQTLVKRFLAEARAASHIQHEGIVNVLDFAHLPDGRPCIIMEYLDGRPLSAYLGQGVQL
jgi:serine/threonine-protein kinase